MTSKLKTSIAGLGLALAVLAATSTGCKPKAKTTTPPTAGAPTVTGPCADWVKAVCEKAGNESQTCQQIKAAAELLSPEACNKASSTKDFSIQKVGEARKVCDELQTKLCKDIGPGETCKMVQTQTKMFPPDRCKMMMERYNDVLADLKRMEKANKPLDEKEQAMLVQGNPPSFGKAGSKVTIVEFSDFQCPYCSQAADTVHKLKEKYGDKIFFVFRQFPLGFHQQAHLAAEASLAAHAQGKFWPMHDKMFANQKELGREKLEAYAKEIGLDMAKFKKALDTKEFAKAVDDDVKLGTDVSVNGTPTMFLNGTRVANPTDLNALSNLIDEALKK